VSEGLGQNPADQRRGPSKGALAAAVTLAVGLPLGWALLGGGRDGSPAAPARPATTPAAGAAVRSVSATYPRFGLRFARPAAWSSTVRRGSLGITSANRTISVAIAMPPGRPSARAIARSDRLELRRLFHAREVGRQRSHIGPLATAITELVGRTAKHHRVRILAMAVSSRYRTYSVQVFTVLKPQRRHLGEVEALLASLRFSAPARPGR
jgi:hypothetical protein